MIEKEKLSRWVTRKPVCILAEITKRKSQYPCGLRKRHTFLFQQVQEAEHAERVTSYERHDRATRVVHRFRLVNDVPLNAANVDVRVNFIEYWEMSEDKVQHFS